MKARLHLLTKRLAFVHATGRVTKLTTAMINTLRQLKLIRISHDRHLILARWTPWKQDRCAKYRALIVVLHALIRMELETRLYDSANRELLLCPDGIHQAGSAARPYLVRLVSGDQAALRW